MHGFKQPREWSFVTAVGNCCRHSGRCWGSGELRAGTRWSVRGHVSSSSVSQDWGVGKGFSTEVTLHLYLKVTSNEARVGGMPGGLHQ